jgi:chromate transport protein ChrA
MSDRALLWVALVSLALGGLNVLIGYIEHTVEERRCLDTAYVLSVHYEYFKDICWDDRGHRVLLAP